MAEVSSQTLHIVARELASELNEARASLEAFGEQQDNLALLRKCNEHLHSVHGALRVAEVYGAALLAEEMGQVAHYLIANFAEKRHLAEGLDALMRAMVQLPTYLERVMSGGRDMALVLLPLLNDLRAVRGHALLSEGTLLLLNLSSDQQANPTAGAGEGALTVAQWARKLRTRFQLGLLGWIKGERIDQNLEILSRTAEKLEHVATTQAVFQLWWVVGSVLEALREGGLEGSASIKRLLGQADREMKRLYELGEARYADSPPLELLNNLLYYVARARTNGPRVAAVRASFRLSELLPVDDGVEQARESLSAPSVKLMKTVAAAIKEDLSRVKDALDIFVRQGGTQVDELAPQLDLLKKIADTLGVLGLGELRDKVQTETADLQNIVAQKAKASEGTLLRMAATLIKVEDSLDEQLVGMIVPTSDASAAPAKPTGPDDIEFRLVTEAVLRECIVNMARIKEAIAHSVEKPREAQAIDQIPQLMRGITAGLLMLGKTRVVEIMEGIDKALQNFVRSDGLTLPQEAVDRLADAIVAVEYYMETIQAGRADPWYMLDNAETCLRFLAEAQPIPRVEAFGGATPDHARTVVIETHAPTVALGTEHEPTAVLDPVTQEVRRPTKPVAAPPAAEPPPMPPALTKPVDREVDPEFVELFIEEAKDEIAKLNQFFPLWDSNPQDQEALVNVRRSFHTLKGSGRMVGAQLIGDFAWSIENMLNRVINKTLDRTPDIMALMRSAVAAVPELVEQLETGRAPQADIAKIINTSNALAGVRPGSSTPAPQAAAVRRAPEAPARPAPVAAAASAPEKKTAPAVAPPRASFEPPMDPGLHEIYAKETAGHLAAIRKFIGACALANAPYPVTEDLHRSCHTLSGTAKTAGARQGIKIAEPLNRYIRKLYDNSIGLSDAGLSALKDSVTAIQQVVDNINESTGFFLDHGRIVSRLVELDNGLDLEISRLAERLASTNFTASEATGEYGVPSATTIVSEHLRVPEPKRTILSSVSAGPVEVPVLHAEEPRVRAQARSAHETVEFAPMEPGILATGIFVAEPNSFEATIDVAHAVAAESAQAHAEAVEITVDPAALQEHAASDDIATSDAAAPAGVTVDSATSAAVPEEITLDSTAASQKIHLGTAAPELASAAATQGLDLASALEEVTLDPAAPQEISLDTAALEELSRAGGAVTQEIPLLSLDSMEDLSQGSARAPQESALASLSPDAAALSSPAVPEEITLSSTGSQDEIVLDSAAGPEEITLDSSVAPEDVTPDSSAAPEKVTFDAWAASAGVTLDSFAASEEVTFDSSAAPEEVTLSSTGAHEALALGSAAASGEVTFDSSAAPEEVTLGSTDPREALALGSAAASGEVAFDSSAAPIEVTLSSTGAHEAFAPGSVASSGEVAFDSSAALEEVTLGSTGAHEALALGSAAASEEVTFDSSAALEEVTLSSTGAHEALALGSAAASGEVTVDSSAASAEVTLGSTGASEDIELNSFAAPEELAMSSTSASEATAQGSPAAPEEVTLSSGDAHEVELSFGATPEEITLDSLAAPEAPFGSAGTFEEIALGSAAALSSDGAHEVELSFGATPEEVTLTSTGTHEDIGSGLAAKQTSPSSTDALEEIALGSGAAEEITLSPAGAREEFALATDAAPEEITLSSTDAPEEVTLDSSAAADEITLSSTGAREEIELDSAASPEVVTLSWSGAPEDLAPGSLAAPEEITLSSTGAHEEIALSPATEAATLDATSATHEIPLLDSSATPEEITLSSTGDADETALDPAFTQEVAAIVLDTSLGEEVTLDSVDADAKPAGDVVELEATDAAALETLSWSYKNFPAETDAAVSSDAQVHFDSTAATQEIPLLRPTVVEEITLDSAATQEAEAISLDGVSEPIKPNEAAPVVELEATDASMLETLSWSYENFPTDSDAAASAAVTNDLQTAAAAEEEIELTSGDDLTQESVVLEVADALGSDIPEQVSIVVGEVDDIDGSSRSLLQMNEPVPTEASDIVVTAAWAAEFEPPVLPVETSHAVNRDDAETTRVPFLRPADMPAPTEAPMEPVSESAAEVAPTATQVATSAIEAAPFAAQAAPVTAAEPVEEEEEYDESDFDPDVAAIFTEEATELLDTADHSLSSWIRDRANNALVFELKRAVHTLKGGARMAGIRSMGDLSHELETLMGLVETGQVPAEEKVFAALQTSLDELHRMRDIVAAGDRAKPARQLMRRIRALAAGEPEPVPAPAVVPAAAVAMVPAPIAPELVPPAALVPTPEPTFDAPAEEIVEIESYSPDDKHVGSETDIVPTLTDAEVQSALEPEVEALSDVEVEFGADELGAVAPREAVRVEEPPAPAAHAANAATGIHAALDVSRVPPELPPDTEQEETSAAAAPAEPQAPALPGREKQTQQEPREFARVDADLLDNLLNNAGEVSIFRSRMEQQVSSIEFNLAELGRTVTRLKDQLRKIELETEAQILHRHHEEHPDRADFDPLELDRYSTIQQLTRAFAESVSDVSSIEGLLENLTREAQNLLLQQSRVVTEMQNGLMRTRMVPFQRHVQRLSRLVRQVANDTDKRAELVVQGANGELDRQVLERMLPPFEHMLRNSVVHGIETPEERVARGKPAQGTIKVGLHREGSEMVIVLEDDGRGIDVNAVRERAKARGLLAPGRVLNDEEAMQLILEPGFSTASNITQHAGRGVGMDVVVNEIKKLGGALFTQSQPGQGVKFTIRLPFTLAITQALIVRTGEELYALPLPSVEGVARISKSEVVKHLAEETPTFNYGGQVYRLQHLGAFVGGGPSQLPELDVSVPLILIRAGEHSTALVTDELVGSREMVVKSVGPQIATIRGIAGATILGDGRIVIILDMHSLVRAEWRNKASLETQPKEDKRTFALVVDDSITVRRVTQRLLERNGMRVMTAKDGVDALSILQEHIPDVILLDIEMPRMDGYELATQVRADARLTDIPIVMITSRTGEKHRARAIEIGVNDYLGKPYQENQLLDAIEPLVQARRRKVS